MVSGFFLCCAPHTCVRAGWGGGRMTTTKALWAQEAHLRPSESQGLILHIKIKRGLCKTPQIHPKPTQPIHTRAHAHTRTHIHIYIRSDLGPYVLRPQFLGEGEEMPGPLQDGSRWTLHGPAEEQPGHGLANEAQHLNPTQQPRSGLQEKQVRPGFYSSCFPSSPLPVPALQMGVAWVLLGRAGRNRRESGKYNRGETGCLLSLHSRF